MENSDETKDNVEEVPEVPPSKPTLITKLKEKRWTFKVKNNFTQYITVEPLILFYMVQLFVVSLIKPYDFHKACVSLDQDTYFCDVITINPNEKIYQLCATYDHNKVYCKGVSRLIDNANCSDIIQGYENNKTKTFVKPEDYRFCKVIEKTTKVDDEYSGPDSLVGVSAMILTFLVVMIMSIWSDKHSKRKICLLLPIFGQLLISIINLHGALSNYLSLDFLRQSHTIIESLSGGMHLFLFGCFSYMNNETIRHKLLFRFGIITLILTIYRYIPPLYKFFYKYYHNDESYINLIVFSLVFNVICLLYVKVILNESKKEIAVKALDDKAGSIKSDEVESIGNGNSNSDKVRRNSKRKQVAKAFSLDVVWDYILIIFKRRHHYHRLIIILFLAIVLVDKISPYDERFTLEINNKYSVDVIDIDGAIFVIISILMLVFKISDVIVAILVIVIPTFSRMVMVILDRSVPGISLADNDDLAYDFYSPFKRIASCSLLLSYVNKDESRIFLIVQAIASLPKVVFQMLADDEEADIFDVIQTYNDKKAPSDWVVLPILLLLPILVFCGLGLLYKLAEKREADKSERMPTMPVENITENQWTFINPTLQIGDEFDKEQQGFFKQKEYSTQL